MHHYLYRTTTDKLPADLTHIEASGDTVLERTKVDDRKWVLLCRKGERTVVDLTVRELIDAIRDGVVAGLRAGRVTAAAKPGPR